MANHDVHIFSDSTGRGYIPRSIVIKVGDTVTWINDAANEHDAHRDISPDKFKTDLLAQGQKKTITFSEVTIPDGIGYSCTPHPDMTGTIVVTK
jgi:plastocyanin